MSDSVSQVEDVSILHQIVIYARGFCSFCGLHRALRRQTSHHVVHEFMCRACYDAGRGTLTPDASARVDWMEGS